MNIEFYVLTYRGEIDRNALLVGTENAALEYGNHQAKAYGIVYAVAPYGRNVCDTQQLFGKVLILN